MLKTPLSLPSPDLETNPVIIVDVYDQKTMAIIRFSKMRQWRRRWVRKCPLLEKWRRKSTMIKAIMKWRSRIVEGNWIGAQVPLIDISLRIQLTLDESSDDFWNNRLTSRSGSAQPIVKDILGAFIRFKVMRSTRKWKVACQPHSPMSRTILRLAMIKDYFLRTSQSPRDSRWAYAIVTWRHISSQPNEAWRHTVERGRGDDIKVWDRIITGIPSWVVQMHTHSRITDWLVF